jgi:hypothetical protein
MFTFADTNNFKNMIQRKQSLFLAISAVSLIALFFFPLATFIGSADSLVLFIYKLESLVPDHSPVFPSILVLLLAVFTAIMLLISIISIFMYKNRSLQVFLVKIGIILNLFIIAGFFFYYVNELETATGAIVRYDAGTYLLLAAFVFFVLAYRGILSDEKLIRSADRLR